MNPIVLIVPGSIQRRTGGFEYDRRMAEGLRALGWSVEIRELDGDFPRPTRASLRDAAGVLAAIPDGTTVVVDGLAFGAMPDQVEPEARRLRLVPVVHLPLADEIGLDPDTASQMRTGERRALAAASLVIVTGRSTARALAGYGVPGDRISIVEPGTPTAPVAHGSNEPLVHMVSVATISPGKGHDILIAALGRVTGRAWRLTCAGSLDRDPETAALLRASVRANRLEDRVQFVGELDEAAIGALYDSADLFVLATRHETYGMAVAEALARGLPVVSTLTGAIPDLVGSEAGLLVPPGDVDALATALTAATDAGTRARLAVGAAKARRRLPTWEQATALMAASLERISL